MSEAQTYRKRRRRLKEQLDSGVVLFLGNSETPMNYPANPYPFRQDSTFLYFWGLDIANAAALIDLDENLELVFLPDPGPDAIIWSGPDPSRDCLAASSGARSGGSLEQLHALLDRALRQNRRIHFLPQYRPENIQRIASLLDISWSEITAQASLDLIRAVVSLRSIKDTHEVQEIEKALDITRAMHTRAMELSRPGLNERDLVGAMYAIASSMGSPHMAFPPILTTQGHILHNPHHGNELHQGDLVINDSGAEAPSHYAADITRTFPVSGRFSQQQRDIYAIVLRAVEKGIEAVRPGLAYRDIHFDVARELVEGLRSLGLMKGETESAVSAGAHALFFPCGLGHMLGLDAHDMEDLGEVHVGYTPDIQRSPQFGACHLRLAKELQPGFVLTVEPGLYFNPFLIDRWEAEGKCREFIDYRALDRYRRFGGVRIEEDVLVEEGGSRLLGKPLAKSLEDVETLASERRERP